MKKPVAKPVAAKPAAMSAAHVKERNALKFIAKNGDLMTGAACAMYAIVMLGAHREKAQTKKA